MSKLETKPPLWTRRWFPWAIVILLVLVAGLLVRSVLSARSQQTELEKELDLQRAAIEALRADAKKNEEDRLIQEAEPVITNSTVSDQLNALQELVTTEYIYTNAGKYENQNQIYIIGQGINIPFTGKRFIVAYDGRIKVGIDISKAKIDVDEAGHTVTVLLPNSQIISHETFEDTLVVLDETNNVFNPISIENYTVFVSGQKADMEQKAIDRGVLTNADQEARAVVHTFLSLLPGMDNYKLVVK